MQRQGAVVSREEIRERLWPDTHVDFDASLHFCIRQVRAALGDSAAEPRYVENVPRRGYRLVPDAARIEAGAEASQPSVRPRRWPPWVLAVPAVLVGLAMTYAIVGRPARLTSPVRIGVMPFQPPADLAGSHDWRPIAEWILEDLAAAAGSTASIVGPTTTAAYESSDAGLSRLAGDYDLQYILNGRFFKGDGGPATAGRAHSRVRRFARVGSRL